LVETKELDLLVVFEEEALIIACRVNEELFCMILFCEVKN